MSETKTPYWLNPDGTRRRGTIPPTVHRTSAGLGDHNQPQSGVDRTGAPWKGTSRVVDRSGRKKANRLSWTAAIRRSAKLARAAREVAK